MTTITVGSDVRNILGPEYTATPEGLRAICITTAIPPGHLVFVKEGIVTVMVRRGDLKEPPPRELYDCVMCNPVDSPQNTMGKEWTDDAIEKAKRGYQ